MRLAVAIFAEAMERKLKANDHKGGRRSWQAEGTSYFFRRLQEEIDELKAAITRGFQAPSSGKAAAREAILGEAADVANFAMMIADAVGAIVRSAPGEGQEGMEPKSESATPKSGTEPSR